MSNPNFKLDALLPRHTRKLLSLRGERLGYDDNSDYAPVPRLDFSRNENHISSVGTDSNYYHYPDNQCFTLRKELAELQLPHGIGLSNITVGNGMTELIDVVLRAFIQPERDSILLFSPYECAWKEAAILNNASLQELPLNSFFQLPLNKAKKEISEHTKIMVINNPNALLGTALRQYDLMDLIDQFAGIVIIDETYIDFSPESSMLPYLHNLPNVVVLQTFSKAWGLAALRVGVAYCSAEISQILRAIKPSFSVSSVAQEQAVKALHLPEKKEQLVGQIQAERERVAEALRRMPFVTHISPSVANFLLVSFVDAKKTFDYLQSERIDVFLCSSQQTHCEQSLRISIGNSLENDRLIYLLNEMPARLSPIRRLIRGLTGTLGKVGVILGVVKKIFG
jgi:histidinol-phosphate aminotransferase